MTLAKPGGFLRSLRKNQLIDAVLLPAIIEIQLARLEVSTNYGTDGFVSAFNVGTWNRGFWRYLYPPAKTEASGVGGWRQFSQKSDFARNMDEETVCLLRFSANSVDVSFRFVKIWMVGSFAARAARV